MLVLEVHEPIEHVIVLVDYIVRFRNDAPCKSAPKFLDLWKIFDKIGTFVGLIRNFAKNNVRRRDLAKYLILRYKAVNPTQLLEKFEYRCIVFHLS